MVGMLQIMTYMFAFYLVVKGLEFVQRAMIAPKETKRGASILAGVVLVACIVAALVGVSTQDEQATSVSAATSSYSPY